MTHITQPLDVSVFGPVKNKHRSQVHHWHSDNPGKVLNKVSLITEVARPAFEAVLSKRETVIKAFEKTGIFPFNPAAANREKLKTGTLFQQGDSSDVDDPVTVDLLVDVVPATAEGAPTDNCDEISVIESVQLSQYEADLDEAVQRSIDDQGREREENILSQPQPPPGPGPKYSAQDEPPPPSCPLLTVEPVAPTPDSNYNSSTPSSGPPTSQASSGIAALPEVARASAPVSSQVQADLGFREDSLPVKRQKLERYQLLMLEPEQLAHFEELFAKGKRFEITNYLWLSWLPLKLAAIGTEQEAFDLVLQERIPKNLDKRTTKRKVKKPMGSARIDPQSEEYKQIFLENKEAEEKKEEKKKENLKKKEQREILKNMKKEKTAEDEKGRKKQTGGSSDLPPPSVPAVPAPAPVPAPAATPARKRGRPKRNLAEDQSDQSLAGVFAKKKR